MLEMDGYGGWMISVGYFRLPWHDSRMDNSRATVLSLLCTLKYCIALESSRRR